jgi:guanine nucleotide exchange factor
MLSPSPPDPDLQLRVFQSMQEQARQPAPSEAFKRSLSAFSGDVAQVSDADKLNKFDLLCPRPGCTSVILKSDIAKLTERPSVQVRLDYFCVATIGTIS